MLASRFVSISCGRLVITQRRCGSALAAMCKDIDADLKSEGTYKTERVIIGQQGVTIKVENQTQPILNFCANNYLGLSSDTLVIEAGKDALDSHGAGMSSVRFICGTQDLHRKLETQLAQFHERQDAILYAACFDANAGLFEVILGKEDAVICDALNHASIIDGVRLCKAHRFVYKHLDMQDLEDKLTATKDCMGRVDIVNSTLGKALGGAMGGYTTGPKQLIDLLRQKSRPYLFSNSLAPSVVGSSSKVMEILMDNSDFTENLRQNTQQFRTKMKAAGFSTGGNEDCPIVPILLGDAKLASEMADRLLNLGIYVIGFSFPVVPKGKARIRVQISAAHSEKQIDHCVAAFIEVATKLAVI